MQADKKRSFQRQIRRSSRAEIEAQQAAHAEEVQSELAEQAELDRLYMEDCLYLDDLRDEDDFFGPEPEIYDYDDGDDFYDNSNDSLYYPDYLWEP